MLKWCAYCQQFMREIAPYDDFSVTHGLCNSCETAPKDVFAGDEVARADFLRKIFHALFDAGRHEDFEAAAGIIENAIAANCRPVDILIGMIAPMLYEIGAYLVAGRERAAQAARSGLFSAAVLRSSAAWLHLPSNCRTTGI